MAKKNLGTVSSVAKLNKGDSLIVEVGGSIRRITLSQLQESINAGDEQLLNTVAWNVPIKQSIQSDPNWGRGGNLRMWEAYKAQCGRYLLTNDGRMAKLNPQNSAVFADGTRVDESKGHVMFYAPRLYYLVQNDPVTGVPVLWMSEHPIGGHFIEESCFGAYMGSLAGGALTSRSGVSPQSSRSIYTFTNDAQANGKDFGLMNYDHARLIVMLQLSETGNANSQEAVGYGVGGSVNEDVWASASGLLTGATKSLGDKTGKIGITTTVDTRTTTNGSRINLLGIEDYWGWYWQMVSGVFFGSSANAGQTGDEMFIFQGAKQPTVQELQTRPSGAYRQMKRITVSGYPRELQIGEHFDIIPTMVGGTSATYWSDYHWGNNTGQLLLVGGSASNGSHCGATSTNTSGAFTHAYSTLASRLAYFGDITFVSGESIMR